MRHIHKIALLASIAAGCTGFDLPVQPSDASEAGTTAGDDDSGSNPIDACAAVNSNAQLTPVNLVVMLDRSGSMGDNKNEGNDPAQRWVPVTNAMETFFADNGSAGMSAALTFFPNAANSCNASDYSTSSVPLTALPNSAVFKPVIDANLPNMADTPTLAAVKGAIQQAQAINAAHPGEKAVILLVTDGVPYCCTYMGSNCVSGVDPNQGYTDVNAPANLTASANAIAAVKATIPTYVIGVGPSVENLDQLATAGGTTLIQVEVAAKPEDTSAALLAALQEIRGNVVSCEFTIPSPPDGRTMDVNRVNVNYTPTGQATQTLVYDADCLDLNGWHFDNPAAPTKVMLCSNACNTVRATPGASVNVVFGCVDRN